MPFGTDSISARVVQLVWHARRCDDHQTCFLVPITCRCPLVQRAEISISAPLQSLSLYADMRDFIHEFGRPVPRPLAARCCFIIAIMTSVCRSYWIRAGLLMIPFGGRESACLANVVAGIPDVVDLSHNGANWLPHNLVLRPQPDPQANRYQAPSASQWYK
jgi:hypothetical protein